MEQPILPLRDAPVLADAAAVWFSRRWGIPAESYRESMEQCLRRKAPVPQWYVVRDGGRVRQDGRVPQGPASSQTTSTTGRT